jgi:hypothetical protein
MPTAVNRVSQLMTKPNYPAHCKSKDSSGAVVPIWALGENHLSESSTVAAVRLHNQNNRETVTIASENHVVKNKRKRCILVACKMRGAVVSLD